MRVTRGESVGLEVAGLDRIPTRPAAPHFAYKVLKSLYDSPLPAIFSAMFCLTLEALGGGGGEGK